MGALFIRYSLLMVVFAVGAAFSRNGRTWQKGFIVTKKPLRPLVLALRSFGGGNPSGKK